MWRPVNNIFCFYLLHNWIRIVDSLFLNASPPPSTPGLAKKLMPVNYDYDALNSHVESWLNYFFNCHIYYTFVHRNEGGGEIVEEKSYKFRSLLFCLLNCWTFAQLSGSKSASLSPLMVLITSKIIWLRWGDKHHEFSEFSVVWFMHQ